MPEQIACSTVSIAVVQNKPRRHTSFYFKMDPYHRIPEKFEEFTQKYHSEIEKTSLSTHIVQIYSLTVAFLTW